MLRILSTLLFGALCSVVMSLSAQATVSEQEKSGFFNFKINDERIESAIENNLWLDESVSNHLIDVKAANGVASRIYGVIDVENQLKVRKPWERKPDQEIKENIQSQIFWSIFVESDEINVKVEDGIAKLNGTVDSWQELNAAIKNAYDGGAKRVESFLQLEGPPEQDPYYGYLDYKFRWY